MINVRGQPRVLRVDGTTILRGLVFPNSDEEKLLHLAACEKIEASLPGRRFLSDEDNLD